MEKDQLDSLATVAVGSEKMPPPHSHYAPSEVYSASESPPAYTRPPMKSTAVQIARIIAGTMIAISVIIGSFILASAWLQARASCTPESIAAMQAQMNLKVQSEFAKHLQPEALTQDREMAKDNLQSLSESSTSTAGKDELPAGSETAKVQTSEETDKTNNDNDNGDQNESEDDYDDSEFAPVHIKLPLHLDLDNLAGNLMQQAHSIVSCVVEHRRSNEGENGENDNDVDSNATDRQRLQRLSGERVAILCESGDPRQAQQELEMLTPIIVPLGTVQIPLQPQDSGYNRYQVHNQYPVPENQRPSAPAESRMNSPFPFPFLPQALRSLPQVSMDMGPPPRNSPHPHMMRPLPHEIHQIPIELRAMKIPMDQEQFNHEQQQQQQHHQQQQQHQPISVMFTHVDRPQMLHPQEQQTAEMMPPPPPPSQPQSAQESQQQVNEQRVPQIMIHPRFEQRQPDAQQEVMDKIGFPFHGIPIEIRKIIEQVPMEIQNIIQHMTGAKPMQAPVPEGARREHVQEIKLIPEGILPISLDSIRLPVEVRHLFEHGNVEDNSQENSDSLENQQQQAKPVPNNENQNEEIERRFPDAANVINMLHQVVEGRAFPVPRFTMPLRPIDTLEVPVEARAQVSDNQSTDDQQSHTPEEDSPTQQQQQQQDLQSRLIADQKEMKDEANRPHFVQPRSVRSVPEVIAQP